MPKQTAYPTENFFFRTTFARVLASGVDPQYFETIARGAGMTVSQSAGNLVIATGTTTNEETILRSSRPFAGNLAMRDAVMLSQRIANNNFYVELVDVLGDNLAYTINSATSVTVTFPDCDNPCPFTADNIGQYVNLGAIAGTAGVIPGRYAIASVNSNQVTFTVAAWPSSGSGTLSLFGWNYHRWTYDGTTATNAKFDSQRSGWNSGDSTLTINTTASPGHCALTSVEDGVVSLADQLVASSTGLQASVRGSRVVNVPQDTCQLYLQIRAVNGTTAPASTTSLTLGMVSIEDYDSDPVAITAIRLQSFNHALPVVFPSTPTVTATGVAGTAAHDAAVSGNPLLGGSEARSSNPTAVSASGDTVRNIATMIGVPVVMPYSIPESNWQYAAAASGIVNTTTAVTIKAAAAAGIRNYITGLQISAEALTNATEVAIRDGAAGTVIWRMKIGTGGLVGGRDIQFPTPLRGTAATLLEVVTLTASGAGAVYVNAQGYIAP